MAPRIVHYVMFIALGLISGPLCAQTPLPAAYRAAADSGQVPAAVLFAVALQESGMAVRGRLVPWPWSLNIAGSARRFNNRRDACLGLREALRQVPSSRIDVGLGQINVGYHGHRVTHPCELLDPYRNLAVMADILREHRGATTNWLIAIGRYYRPAGGPAAERYQLRVAEHVRRLGTPGTLLSEAKP